MWKINKQSTILETLPFKVEELHFSRNQTPSSHPYYRLSCRDWVNVIPLTTLGEVLLIKQFRAGVLDYCLEIPGGVIDAGEDPKKSGMRELEEETGYKCSKLISLGSINPNPSIQTNLMHYYLALDCQPTKERIHFPDLEEDIEIIPYSRVQVDKLIQEQKISNGLSLLGLTLAMRTSEWQSTQEKNHP